MGKWLGLNRQRKAVSLDGETVGTAGLLELIGNWKVGH